MTEAPEDKKPVTRKPRKGFRILTPKEHADEYVRVHGEYHQGPQKKRKGRPRGGIEKILTYKQELYCRMRVERSLSKTKAYAAAFPDAKHPQVYAYALEKKPNIIKRLAQLREERAGMAKFYGGPEEALARWNEIFQLAMADGDLAMATKAQLQIDKITGADQAALMHDDASKSMFLNSGTGGTELEFKNQITALLTQLQDAKHTGKARSAQDVRLAEIIEGEALGTSALNNTGVDKRLDAQLERQLNEMSKELGQ